MSRSRIIAIGITLVWLATMYALADARMDQLAPTTTPHGTTR